ncbi:hypothetical protein BH09GEM1_BH09GEM1_36230 [soil metagenome]
MQCVLRAVSGLLTACAWGMTLNAQTRPVVEVGVTAVRFTDDDVSTVGPLLRLSASAVQRRLFESFELDAMGSRSAATAFASVTGGVRTASLSSVQSEIVAELSGAGTTSSATRAITGILNARSAYDAGSMGVWMRVSGQVASRENTVFFGGSVDAASWWRFAQSRLSATMTQEWTRAELYTGPGRAGPSGTVPVQYLEGGLNLQSESDAAVFQVGVSTRRDAGALHLFEQSLSGSAAYWTGGTIAVVLTAARQLPDYVRGGDAVDAVRIGVRFGQASPTATRSAHRVALVQLTGPADTRTVRIHVIDARTVEIMGDFTNWESRAMTRNGATFESTMRVSSGTHRLMVRIDGGEWRPPANTPTVDDDFGGRVGLLVVP